MTSQMRLQGYCADGCQPSAPQLANADCVSGAECCSHVVSFFPGRRVLLCSLNSHNEKNNGNYKTNSQRSSISLPQLSSQHRTLHCSKKSSWWGSGDVPSCSTPKVFFPLSPGITGVRLATGRQCGEVCVVSFIQGPKVTLRSFRWLKMLLSHCSLACQRDLLSSTPLTQHIGSLKCL